MKIQSLFILLFFSTVGLYAQDEKPVFHNSEVLINNGSKYANSYKSELKIKSHKATSMLLSNRADFQGGHWVDFQDYVLEWPLDPKDGVHTVYAKFKDANGNESEIFTDEITVDTAPPENPHLSIDVENKITNDDSFLVDLSLSATDAKYVMISNHDSFYGRKWQLFKDNLIFDWELESGDDGKRTVHVKFRDKAGNESEVITDEIVIDREPPLDAHMTINNGEYYLVNQSRKSPLEVFARGADSMMVSFTESFDTAYWQLYEETVNIVLEGEDGLKEVYVKFKDAAKNISKPIKGEVYLDITPPRNCEVVINDGAETTNQIDKLVTLSLIASDADQVLISNSPIFQNARWKNFVPKMTNFQLADEDDGIRTVYVKFKDKAGNISKTYRDTIILERGF